MINLVRFVLSHPLTKDKKISGLLRVLKWQIKSRFANEIIVPWISGTKIAAKKGMTGATGNIYVGLHEFVDMAFLLHFLRIDDLFLDIGANVGSYTILASGVCNARTVAFEPDPTTAKYLRRNIEINLLGELVEVREIAVGAHEEAVRFTRNLDTVNHIATAADTDTRLITLKRIDDEMHDRNPAMIKMDIEGYEENALIGAARILSKESLQAIELETVTPKMEETLAVHGFERVFYDPFSRKLADEPFEIKASNALFVRSREFVYSRVRNADKVRVLDKLI
jgi:FkbM family methyltransferase